MQRFFTNFEILLHHFIRSKNILICQCATVRSSKRNLQISVNGKTTISFLNMHVCVQMNVCVEVGGGVLKKRRSVRTVPCLVFSYKNMRLTI